jgi:hypothetical protein
MNHTLADITIEKNQISMKATHQLVLQPGDTLTLVFNGEIVPMKRSEWDALIAYRDWRSNDDPRGENKSFGEPLPSSSGRALLYHACAERLRRIHLGLHRLLQSAILRY